MLNTAKLIDLKEGDKFKFVNAGDFIPYCLRLSSTNFYVEGQYPQFGCTTICRESGVKSCRHGQCLTNVFAVHNNQDVLIVKRNAISICHKVTFN